MTGIHMAVLGSGGSRIVTTGSWTSVIISSYQYFYGYNSSATLIPFGSINDDTFKGATIKTIYSASRPGGINQYDGEANFYTVIFSGDRRSPAGFFNTLTINGTLVVGSVGSPTYTAGTNETAFVISLTTPNVATLFGITDGVLIPVVLT